MRIVVLAISAAFASSAAANDCDYRGSGNVLEPLAIRAVAETVSLTFENATDKAIASVRAEAWVYDPLGNLAGAIVLRPEVNLAPGETKTQETLFRAKSRLLEIDLSTALVSLCVEAVAYENGDTEEFQ